MYADGRGLDQEHRALTRWMPSAFSSHEYPEIVDARAGDRVLVFADFDAKIPTRPVPGVGKTAEVAYRWAGQFLARIHGIPVGTRDPLPLFDAVCARFEAALGRASAWLDSDWRARIRALEPRAEDFEGEVRVACHRDFTPSNWRISERSGASGLMVLDFEHARPDHWLVDVVKLSVGPCRAAPEQLEAFFEGYGRRPQGRDHAALATLCLLHGLGSVAWAGQHREAELLADARAVVMGVLSAS
jgi:hypothetical protein